VSVVGSLGTSEGGYGRAAGLACVVAVVVLAAASGVAAADQHDPDSAPTYDSAEGEANVTVTLPDQTDHHPGDQNAENASIELSVAAERAFAAEDAEEGLWVERLVIRSDWMDYSACTVTGNTKTLGIDRGNNNSGTSADESMLEHQSGSELDSDGVEVDFYGWADSGGLAGGGTPPYLAGEDAVVLGIGQGSNDGPCLTMTDEPGWYQMQAYLNGTVATKCTEEGNETCEPDEKQFRGVTMASNYVYVCECDDRREAVDELGLPPNETPTPTATPDPTVTETPQPADTEGDGPGLGLAVAVVALCAAASLRVRRG
jgi:hypothetical protein